MASSIHKLTRTAHRFIKVGTLGRTDPSELADACNLVIRRECQNSLETAIKLAEGFLRHARPHGGILLLTALRAKGWASLANGSFKNAKKTYLSARSLTGHDKHMRARIDRILVNVYMYLGEYDESRRRARLAITVFKKLNAETDLAKTRVNLANLLHRQDRHKEARKLFRQAGEFFSAAGDNLSAALCFHNLAHTNVQLFDFDGAETLYTQAEKIFRKHGYDLYAVDCRNGLAWLRMLEGNYHIALKELSECEDGYRKASHKRGIVLCQLDRAEAYLGLSLWVDALDAACAAEQEADCLGIDYERAKAQFFQAKAYQAMGIASHARKALKTAESGFERLRNRGFQGAVALLSSQLSAGGGSAKGKLRTARKRFSQAQLPLWEAICDLELLGVRPDDRNILRRLAANPAVATVPPLLARHQTILGDRMASRGRMTQAKRHWSRAADVLDSVRAKLPPVDLRSGFTGLQSDPHPRLIEAHIKDDPAMAAAWSERYRTAGPWAMPTKLHPSAPERNRAEESLSKLANQVTQLVGRIERDSDRRTGTGARDPRSLFSLQQSARLSLANLDSGGQVDLDRPSAILDMMNEISAKQPIVQFQLLGADLICFISDNGEIRHHCFADGRQKLNRFFGQWRFLLSGNLYSKGVGVSPELGDERRLWAKLGSWLWSPLEIPTSQRRLLIVPDGKLSNLPFAAIIHKGRQLVDDHEIVLTPSLRHYLRARRLKVTSSSLEAFVGRTDGLKYPRRELSVLKRYTNGNLRVHDHCRRDDVPRSRAARLWHYTGHATLRADNPFYSSLEMADGPLFAADFRLKNNKVGLVMLAGCRTGEQVSLPGEESTGLVRSLLEMGAKNVVATHWAVSDRSAYLWTKEFYESYFDKKSAAASVRHAAIGVRKSFPSAAHWAAFSVFGAG